MPKATPYGIVIGAHKSGTSWLASCLHEHPELRTKEDIDYFYTPRKLAMGQSWYTDHFKDLSAYKTIDISRVYLFSEASAVNIHAFNPNIKLVVMLRNPIERAYTHYLQNIKVGHISAQLSFKEAIANNKNILLWGRYKMHMKHYLEHFTSDQIHIIVFDDLKSNPEMLLKGVYQFLEIDATFTPTSLHKRINAARIPRFGIFDRWIRLITRRLRKTQWGTKIWWNFKNLAILKYYYQLNSNDRQPQHHFPLDVREELTNYFEEDINYIKKLLDRPNLDWS